MIRIGVSNIVACIPQDATERVLWLSALSSCLLLPYSTSPRSELLVSFASLHNFMKIFYRYLL
jgi:hypothetical protein